MNNLTQTLESSVDAAIYTAMQAAHPALVEAVRAAIARGETPAQIERRLRRKFGAVQAVRDVRHVAEHIRRNNLAQVVQP